MDEIWGDVCDYRKESSRFICLNGSCECEWLGILGNVCGGGHPVQYTIQILGVCSTKSNMGGIKIGRKNSLISLQSQ